MFENPQSGCFQWFKDTNLKANHNDIVETLQAYVRSFETGELVEDGEYNKLCSFCQRMANNKSCDNPACGTIPMLSWRT